PEEIRTELGQLSGPEIEPFFAGEHGNDLWSIVYFASRLEEMVQLAAGNFEPAHLAKYAFQLADQFNTLYQDKRFHMLKEPDARRKIVLLMTADLVRRRLERALALLGIETPERM
ncbi:MAG TPA: DALR anticodon-binding domain-containing protein, partial [Blastocatellia bacterium]|nr:DALR anticodon-binding domain-containing protein [Blastocatellia bacterium]